MRVLKDDHQKLAAIRASVGFRNMAYVVHSLLEQQARNLATVEAVMEGKVPVVLVGKPLSGKTYFIKQNLLPTLKGSPVLLIDSWGEYLELRNIGYDIYGLNFREFKEQVRFIPNSQSRVAETEIEALFANLDLKRQDLSEWVIVVEEAHSYKNVPSFLKFLYGSRHIVRKLVAVTPQIDAFQGLVTLTICGRQSPPTMLQGIG